MVPIKVGNKKKAEPDEKGISSKLALLKLRLIFKLACHTCPAQNKTVAALVNQASLLCLKPTTQFTWKVLPAKLHMIFRASGNKADSVSE